MINNKQNYLVLPTWIVSYQVIGYLMGQVTQANIPTWYATLSKSPLTPPNITFGIVWTLLYIVLAYLGYVLFHQMRKHANMQKTYIAQMLLNWAWTPVFFGAHQTGLAFLILCLMVCLNLCLSYGFWGQSKLHGTLSIVYQLWITFACYLNFYTWWMNP